MNALYDRARQAFLEGAVAWLVGDIKAVLIDLSAYTPDLGADEFLSDIPVPARIATSASFSGKTSAAGVADASDVSFASVPNVSVEALVIFEDTGVDTTSRLVAFLDSVTGLPVQTNLGTVTVIWDDGPNRIFKL